MDLGLAGKRAVVGASTAGLGRAIAEHLHQAGAQVAICGTASDRVTQSAAEIGGAVPIVADLTTTEGAVTLVREATQALGGVDILVVNGPGPPSGRTPDFTVDDYARATQSLLLPAIAMVEDALPGMKASGWGRILAVTSISVRQPIQDLVLSTTARSALTGFLRSLALDVADIGVTVNTLEPGLHATNRVQQVYGSTLADAVVDVPTGQLGDPDDFGAVAAFLCSTYAKYITGQSIQVDGGLFRGP